MELSVTTREIRGKKVKGLRRAGQVPGVLYGPKVKESKPVTVSQDDLKKIYDKSGENTLVDLKIGKEIHKVLINSVDRHHTKSFILHVDFYEPALDKAVNAEVELVFEGEAPAVRELGGILVKNIHDLPIEALPADLPHEIKVDISSLKTFEDEITVKDLLLPKGVKTELDLTEVVALVVPPRSEEELAGLNEKPNEDVSQVEVVNKKQAESKEEE